jgi:hypothetical protein
MGVAVSRAGADTCADGPPGPDPALARDGADPLRARWAALQMDQLARDARALEANDPIRAYLLWRRLRCFDPDDPEANAGVARTRPVRVYRPAVVPSDRWVRAVHFNGDDPWLDLAVAIPAGEPAPAQDSAQRSAERRRLVAVVALRLERAEEHLRQAHFHDALVAGEEARAGLDSMRRSDDLVAPHMRLAVLLATAQLALGDETAARASLARALTVDPDFSPDPERTPPKLMRSFEAVRASAESAP